jgi:hypothetical protein
MPSQRLLKMMDPLGHLGPRRTLATATAKAVVWAQNPKITVWIAGELRAAGIEPLLATSFRHVDSSLRRDAHPPCALAVIDFAAVSSSDVLALTAARWSGYRGPIIAIAAPANISAQTRTVVGIDAIVMPDGDEPLRDVVARVMAEH